MTNPNRPHIFMTNDDTVRSPALTPFIRELRVHYDLSIIVPNIPRSGISKALSFNEPIRFIEGPTIEDQQVIETTGTPADAITWCRTYSSDIDLVIAGPNLGLNVSAHSILTSGTVGAIIEAALWKIPGIAFSIDTPSNTWFIPTNFEADFDTAAIRSREIIAYVLDHGLPPGVDFLNVSLPHTIDEATPIRFANTIRVRFNNKVKPRTDPHGVQYHWIVGKEIRRLPKTSDVYIATKESQIVITPMKIPIPDDKLVETTQQFFQPLIQRR